VGDRAELWELLVGEQHRDAAAIGGLGALGDLIEHGQGLTRGIDDRLELS
jgi:hypothetical protein